jgi:hypothetical protein
MISLDLGQSDSRTLDLERDLKLFQVPQATELLGHPSYPQIADRDAIVEQDFERDRTGLMQTRKDVYVWRITIISPPHPLTIE